MTTSMSASSTVADAPPTIRRSSVRLRLRSRSTAVAVAAAAASILLAGCVSAPTVTASPLPLPLPSPSSSASSGVTPVADPALVPNGTAEDNLDFFNLVNERFLELGLVPGGRPIIENLVAAGFDSAAMQVTLDATPIGRPVDSVQFSVRMRDSCLIGQASAAGYIGIVGPPVSATSCLAGITRAIDW